MSLEPCGSTRNCWVRKESRPGIAAEVRREKWRRRRKWGAANPAGEWPAAVDIWEGEDGGVD